MTMREPPYLELTNLTIKYLGRKLPTVAAVSLTIHAGETVLLLGASGSGKSTLALTLNGLIPHALGSITTGTVHVDGLETQRTPVAELAQRVGIVFQDPEAQFVTLKVEDEILFGLENLCLPPDQMDARVAAALDQVGMAAYRQRPVDQLSGGQKQRIALAALLALDPQVLVFDEPTANLDPLGTEDVFALIAAHKAQHKHTIILIEHKLDALMHLIDRVIVLGERGAILADGPPRSVFADHADVLVAHGVWMPQVCLFAQRLRKQGVQVAPFPITLDEAEQALRTLAGAAATVEGDDQVGLTGAQPIGAADAPVVQPRIQPAPTEAAFAVEVCGLSFSYGPQPILNQIELRIPQGDFWAIIGANGAGKTTLAHHLMGILTPPRDRVFVQGHDVSRLPAHELVRHVGYVFQNPEHQFITDSVFDEVAYGLRVQGLAAAEIQARSTALLERFGLARYGPANPFTLSHGEKRRLSVATMLAMGQNVLILDEPTFGQDQRNAAVMLALLRELHAEGRTIIVITHDMALVAEHAQHVAVMNQGSIIFHGPTPVAFAQPELLNQARLTLPPMAQLAARLGHPDRLTITALEAARLPTGAMASPLRQSA
jgi:energy-coupling factor transport system ATP-binding protein